MALYEQRLQTDLTQIRHEILLIGERVENALHNALSALFTQNDALANATILGDLGINRLCLNLDRLCHHCIIRHQPSAGHLRLVLSVLGMLSELERVGDYTTTISRASLHMQSQPAGSLRQDLDAMAHSAGTMLHQALTAFATQEIPLARNTMQMADGVGRQLDVALADLAKEEEQHPDRVSFILDMSTVFYMLERVSDRAKNICEETLFMVAGETKPEKVFTILFIDQENAIQSQMAKAIARQSYPTQAIFRSAGLQAGTIPPSLVDFMRQQGCPMDDLRPRALETLSLTEENQIIVSLEGPVRSYPLELSFHTIFLDWTVGDPPTEMADPPTGEAQYAALYQEITAQVRGLMTILRGEEVGSA